MVGSARAPPYGSLRIVRQTHEPPMLMASWNEGRVSLDGMSMSWHDLGATSAGNDRAFTETRWGTIRGDIAPYPF